MANQLKGPESGPEMAAFDIGSSRPSLNDLVVARLRDAILEGAFEPGERLVEKRLAELFQVSRNPIREALRILSAEGIIEISPRKGARVPNPSAEEVRELIVLRAEIEGICARFAVQHCDTGTREILKKLQADCKSAKRANDLDTLRELNLRFHDIVADAGNNRYLTEILAGLRKRTAWLFTRVFDSRVLSTWKDHEKILAAILAGDEDKAARLASQHVLTIGDELLSSMAQDD